jgi:AcrR family transcriptional regulator
MPAPERTTLDVIVRAGRDLLESAGLEGLTMQAVADRVGVKAPSLYKRVRNRDGLVTLVVEATVLELGERLDASVDDDSADPRHKFVQLARAARRFAHAHPAGFRLIFAPRTDLRLDSAELVAVSAAVLRVARELAGEEHALPAARTATAWLNGFVSMELAGAFNLGGDVDQAFDYGIARITEAIARNPE